VTIKLALHDALANQRKHGAAVILTLPGVQFEGELKPPPEGRTYHQQDTILIHTRDGGWQTIVIEDLSAVGVRPGPTFD
jgi:hypothetical protein